MPTPYTPAGVTFPAFPWNLVKDGEVYNFSSIQQDADPAKGLIGKCMDAIAYLYNTGVTGAATVAAIGARINTLTGGATGASVTRFSSALGVPLTPSDWTSVSGVGDWITSVTTATDLVLPLSETCAPHGATLTGVTVYITPAVHASIAGLTLPTIKLYSVSSAGVATQIGVTTSDTSASFGAYSVNHPISIAGLTTTIDRSANRYVVVFESEHAGGNAASGCGVWGVKATVNAL